MSGDSVSVVTYTCQYEMCGKTFDRRKQQRGRKPKFCSGKCRNRDWEDRNGIERGGTNRPVSDEGS